MPGYGVQPADEGTGLLPWSWAVERLTASHDYWLATTWPDGRPHVMPVWGVWWQDALWFSCGLRSRKARNIGARPPVRGHHGRRPQPGRRRRHRHTCEHDAT